MKNLMIVLTALALTSSTAKAEYYEEYNERGEVIASSEADARAAAAASAQASGEARSSSEQAQGQQQEQQQGQHTNTTLFNSGDNINYEVAAHKATMITSGCQVGGAVDGIKFGFQSIKQSPACLMLQSSADALMTAAALQCEDIEYSVAKGIVRTGVSECHRLRGQLIRRSVSEREEAVQLLRRDAKHGVVKRAFRWFW